MAVSFTKNTSLWVPALLATTNLIVKGIFLSNNSLGGDEPFSVFHAQMDMISIIKLLSQGNNPPLYEIILHYWIGIFGISEFAVRFPSLVFSTVTIIFIYKLASTHLSKQIALYAGVIFIFSNYQISFAHEARVYALLGMLSAISMYYFLNILHVWTSKTTHKNTIRLDAWLLILSNVFLIYAHYFGFFILITQFLFLVSHPKLLVTFWKQIILGALLIAILYLPNFIVFFRQLFESSVHGTWVAPPNGFISMYNMFWGFCNVPMLTVVVLVLLISCCVKYFWNKKKYEAGNLNIKLVVFWFCFIFFFMFSVSYFVPMFLDRYLMPASIAFCLLLGIALDYLLKEFKYQYILPMVVCILFIITTKPNFSNKRDVKETIQKIKELKSPNTLLVVCPHHFILNFAYYYDINLFKDFNTENITQNIDQQLKSQSIYSINHIDEVDYQKWNHIVFLDAAANFSYPDNNILTELNANYSLQSTYEFYEIFNVYEYSVKH